MNLLIIIVLLLVGLIMISKGGDYFVDAAIWTAEKLHVPKFLIGATIVSIATTLPELIVSLIAAVQGKVELSVGNAVGSVTANTSMIMAIALVCLPMTIKRSKYMKQSVYMLVAAALLVICGFNGKVDMLFSVVLLAMFCISMYGNVKSAKFAMAEGDILSGEEVHAMSVSDKREAAGYIAKFVFGAAGIVIGAQLLVDNGSALAELVGVSERVIGVTIVAIGTSLPELVTTITAIRKNQVSLSIGNIIGANFIDLTLILPLCSLVSGKALPITAEFARIDLPVCLAAGCIALIPSLIFKKFSRWQGILLLGIYLGYMVITVI